mgnify:CR=1 FL=1
MGVNVGVIIVRVANIMLLFGYGYDNQLIIILTIYIYNICIDNLQAYRESYTRI